MEIPDSLWPVTVFQSRYSGVYEGGSWFAVAKCESIPQGSHGDDDECLDWFRKNENGVGIGDDPNSAVRDLLNKHYVALQLDRIIVNGPRISKSDWDPFQT